MKEKEARIRAAEQYDDENKLPGRPWGPLGPNGLKVYRHILDARDYAAGRFDQAAETIARTLKISIKTVHRAKDRLKQAGLLEWYRRTEPIEDPDPFGPQVRQIPNAYILPIPKWLGQKLKSLLRKAPTPADHAWMRRQDHADTKAMLKGASAEEKVTFHIEGGVDGDPLRAALTSLLTSHSKAQNASDRETVNPPPRIEE